MTLPELREAVIRIVSAAIVTDADRYDSAFIDAIIHQYRAEAIWIIYQKEKRINSLWTQQFIAEYSADLQEGGCIRFACPPLVALDNKTDGAIYVGSIDGDIAYRKVTSRAELANNDLHRFSRSNSRNPKALYSDGVWEIHGDPLIQDLRVDGIFMNPTEIKTYNIDIDQYPLDDKTIVLMKKLIFASELIPMASQEPDRISDSTDKKKPESR